MHDPKQMTNLSMVPKPDAEKGINQSDTGFILHRNLEITEKTQQVYKAKEPPSTTEKSQVLFCQETWK